MIVPPSDDQCEHLLDPVNGEVHQTGRYLGDRAIYTCAAGWEIVGPEERVCQADGRWSNNEPYCKKRGKTTASRRRVTHSRSRSTNSQKRARNALAHLSRREEEGEAILRLSCPRYEVSAI